MDNEPRRFLIAERRADYQISRRVLAPKLNERIVTRERYVIVDILPSPTARAGYEIRIDDIPIEAMRYAVAAAPFSLVAGVMAGWTSPGFLISARPNAAR